MSKQEHGGQAFPLFGVTMVEQKGMTLRDYFAAKSLPGMMAAVMADECHNWLPIDFAKEAYKIADAMLEERNK